MSYRFVTPDGTARTDRTICEQDRSVLLNGTRFCHIDTPGATCICSAARRMP